MLALKENQKLYLSSWNYNAAKILTELAQIVENEGGKVKPTERALIINRSIFRAIEEEKERIERLSAKPEPKSEITTKLISASMAKLEELEQINNEPLTVTHTSYITFTLDGFYYYYQTNDNPFFEFFYIKQEIENGKVKKNTYLDKDEKRWLHDNFFSYKCSDEEIKEAAHNIFNMLVNANTSQTYRERTRKRVYDYNGKHHYKMTYSPIEYKTIDF